MACKSLGFSGKQRAPHTPNNTAISLLPYLERGLRQFLVCIDTFTLHLTTRVEGLHLKVTNPTLMALRRSLFKATLESTLNLPRRLPKPSLSALLKVRDELVG